VLEVRQIAGHGPAALHDGAIHGMRETMRAVQRLTIAILAGGLWLAPSMVLAQSSPPTTNTPATDTIGPRELQNFNLNGSVTRPADTPPATRTQPRQPVPTARPTTDASGNASVAPPSRRPTAQAPATVRSDQPPARPGQSLALDFSTTAAPPPGTASEPAPDLAPAAEPLPVTLVPDQKLLLWPWLLLAAVIAAGALFLWRRRQAREAYAGGPSIEVYLAPEPVPAPAPEPAPPPAPTPAPPPAAPPVGIVSKRLRPSVDIGFVPLGCMVDDERVTIEFEVHLQNNGTALARDVVVEASMFNAGPTQEQDIARFYAEPIGQGERIEAIPPLQGVTIRTALVAPRANIQMFELADRKVFVPLIAFNALYRWGSSRGQTSVSYMLGREAKGDKLGPLRLDLGPRAFTQLGVRLLPTSIRQ